MHERVTIRKIGTGKLLSVDDMLNTKCAKKIYGDVNVDKYNIYRHVYNAEYDYCYLGMELKSASQKR